MSQEPRVIAVVDDDEAVRESLVAVLEISGYRVACFPSGPDFLQDAALNDSHCVILDINLPGMDGWQILREVRAQRGQVPVVMISGGNREPVPPGGGPAADAYLRKPVRRDIVLQTLSRLIGD